MFIKLVVSRPTKKLREQSLLLNVDKIVRVDYSESEEMATLTVLYERGSEVDAIVVHDEPDFASDLYNEIVGQLEAFAELMEEKS